MKKTVKVCFFVLAGILGLLSVFAFGHTKGKTHYKKSLKKKERIKKGKKR